MSDTRPVSDFLLRNAQEQAIHAQIMRLGWAIDHGDWDALVLCLHPEVALIRPDGQVLQGPQAVRHAYAQRDPDRITRHLLSNVHWTWLSPDRVQVHSTVLLWTGRLSDALTPAGRPSDPLQKLGEHCDVWAHLDGHWCLLRRQSEFVFFR
jgi:hypothetical protein